MQKFISTVAAVALVAATSLVAPVRAAGLSPLSDTLSTIAQSTGSQHTITFKSTSGVADNGTIVIDMSNFTPDLSSLTVTDIALSDGVARTLEGADSIGADEVVISDAADTITITVDAATGGVIDAGDTVTVTIGDGTAAGLVDITNPAAGTHTVTITAGADSATLAFVTVATNSVSVTATVDPVVTFSIGTGTDGNSVIAFGTLVSGTYSKDDVNLSYASNATGGITVTMASTGLATDLDGNGTKDNANDREIGVQDIATGAAQTGEAGDYYKVSTVGAVGTVTFDDTDNAISAAGGRDMRTTQDVVTATTPTSSSQFVTVGAKIGATTDAGSYSDTLTFTLTSTF